MGLWESFGEVFQHGNVIPKTPAIPKTPRKEGQYVNSRDYRGCRNNTPKLKSSYLKKDDADVSPEVFAGGPPMIAPDMPDWEKFCGHYPHCDDVNCPHYEPEKDCWCWLWEACYPGVVRWYSWDEAMQYVQDLEEKICLKS